MEGSLVRLSRALGQTRGAHPQYDEAGKELAMRIPHLLTLGIVLIAAIRPAPASGFGPGEAAAGPRPGSVDFKVLVWYRRDDPLGTFKYQVYDVRKGEYTRAVDEWIELVRNKHPDYILTVRNVDLRQLYGQTELLKVGSVIKNELLGAAAFAGIVLGTGPSITRVSPPSPARSNPIFAPRLNPLGSSGANLGPNPYLFPVPYPYPRPFR
jgi:hypothetical protein